MKTKSIYFLILIAVYLGKPAVAQTVSPAGAAKSTQATPEEISKAKMAVEANPEDAAAHKAYIKAAGPDSKELVAQYDKWIEKYPKSTTVPLAVGEAYYNREMPQATPYLLKAANIDPKNAKIWYMLSIDAERWGQEGTIADEYMHKAMLADPKDPAYAFYYTDGAIRRGDRNSYIKAVYDLADRFPEHERGAQGLYWLAERSSDNADRIKYFEELKKRYPPKKFNWSASGMTSLYDAYVKTSPEKALALATEMGDDKTWGPRKPFAENIIQVDKLTKNGDYQAALATLTSTGMPRYARVSDFVNLKKATLLAKSGGIKSAYDTLAAYFAKLPTEELFTGVMKYGKQSGKSDEQIKKDIQTLRNSSAEAAPAFELDQYLREGKMNLTDLKGKVVLLTFWFPGCGPCRGEFPHFQSVINEYKGKNVAYVGINVSPEQDPYVIPFMKNSKYTFVPLHGTNETIKDYGVRGEPENFLIDQEGRIIFRGFRIEENSKPTLELMINALL